jgi:hypothetical protein
VEAIIEVETGMSNWQPIETAPKDGENILMFWPYWGQEAMIGWYDFYHSQWISNSALSTFDQDDHQPTHWMPLPDPPEAT